ncbi:hypothetical protein MKX01_034981 [Papaver californicum]|nr:hypothetical protein MKX01_034981 [Papaver californicum]
MATFSFKSLRQQQQHFLGITHSKCCSFKHLNLNTHHFLFHAFTLKHKLHQEISSLFITKASISCKLEPQIANKNATQVIDSTIEKKMNSGLSPLRSREERVKKKSNFNALVEEKMERQYRRRYSDVESRRKREMGSGVSSFRSKDDEKVEIKPKRSRGKKMSDKSEVSEEKYPKKKKLDMVEVQFRIQLDQCSKRGDFSTAIVLYDSVQQQGNLELGQYHYTVLLYLCSSAAVGVVSPMKSGNDSRTFNIMNVGDDVANGGEEMSEKEDCALRLDDNVKRIALAKGFEIYEKMCSEKIPLNEAALTSVARLAMSIGDGEMAFQMVNKMKELGINPRLRSYGPALFTFCNKGDVEKAFKVEGHMLENGVYPEGPELEALLKVSVETGTADKVYHVLQKLRSSVRKVSVSTADLIEKWFGSKAASRVGKRKWDQRLILEAVKNGGGGWHGQGWLGKGSWAVKRTYVGADGYCEGCGEKLVTIDLDPIETENFAKSVASIAMKREKNSSFQRFQKWLDYYGPFEAVVDGANVGLLTQKSFSVSKVNAIVNGIRQRLPSKKLPLIIVHHKRIQGGKMEEPANKKIIEKWKNADAIFTTPTGSNDDWYWLYAAIKFKCLLVTNDEMRDHIFQLLGNDFFPRWKERHQVHFNFSEWGPEFEMPPPCSVVIQESECGHWHIPVASEQDSERDRTWLCATRMHVENQDFPKRHEDAHLPNNMKSKSPSKIMKQPSSDHGEGSKIHQNTRPPPAQATYRNLRNILSASLLSNYQTPISDIEDAEKLSGCTIDFQI